MRYTLAIASGLLAAFAAVPVSAGEPPTANCEVRFDARWSATTHPQGFPANAFPHFSPLIGTTHNDTMRFWSADALASAGVQAVAETGNTSIFSNELQSAAGELLTAAGIDSPGTISLNFTVNADTPLVTLITMIAPSPDWFIGISGFDLRDGNGWVREARVDLLPWDAGTDSGASYTAGNQMTDPPQPISMIRDGGVGNNVPLGSFTFRCTNTNAIAVHRDDFES